MKRKRMNRARSRKNFRKGNKTHKRNASSYSMRGGIRL